MWPVPGRPSENRSEVRPATGARTKWPPPSSIAVAAARLGHESALISRVGDDPFGRFVRAALEELGVSTAYLGTDPRLPTPVTFCEIFPPDDFPLYFYRFPMAPDLRVGERDIPPVAVKESRLFWCTLTGLSAEPSRTAHQTAWELRGRAPLTVIDLDYRAQFWSFAAPQFALGLFVAFHRTPQELPPVRYRPPANWAT